MAAEGTLRVSASAPRELPRNWRDIRREWPALTAYQRFETAVAFLLTVIIAAIIVIALVRLVMTVIETLVLQALNPLEHEVFQLVFGEILTLLIALEFNHTLQYVIFRQTGIVQARVVIVIALLALARKVIVTDLTSVSAGWLLAFGALVVSLGLSYWLLSQPGGKRRASAQHRMAAAERKPV
jgi:uncharacterized membrane protein (DUF373 family)